MRTSREILSEALQRLRGDMTQDAAATKCGVSRNNWNRWEKMVSLPDSAQLIKVADGFGVSIDAMLGRDKEQAAPIPVRRDPWIESVERILSSGNRQAILGLQANIQWCLSYLEHGEAW